MKKLIFGLGIIITGFSCTVASASHACCDAPYNGLYIGGNIGVISHATHLNEEFGEGFVGKTFIGTDFTAGARAGFDWRCGYSLIGIVADWNYSNLYQSNLDGYFITKLDQYTTIRGRVGITSYNCLLYLTAGATYAHFSTTYVFSNWTRNRWGWTTGFGTEYILRDHLSLGFDLLYMGFANVEKHISFSDTAASLGKSDSVWVGRFIFNYYFGDPFKLFGRR